MRIDSSPDHQFKSFAVKDSSLCPSTLSDTFCLSTYLLGSPESFEWSLSPQPGLEVPLQDPKPHWVQDLLYSRNGF